MGAKYYDAKGALCDVEIPATIYSQAANANLGVAAFINQKYPTDIAKFGTTFNQMLASTGLVVPKGDLASAYGLRPPTMADVLDGKASIMAAAGAAGGGAPSGNFGVQSRILFPAALVAYMESSLVKDYTTDADQFDKLIAIELAVANDKFEQPLINFNTPSGPNTSLSRRRTQLAGPASMMSFTTSDVSRRIPTYALGMEFSNEALRATTLDLVGLSVRRQLSVERDSWVNTYLGNVFNGDNDINTGSISSLGYTSNTTTWDAACPSGKITQSAWIQWLWSRRKYRKIDWVICDIATYLLIESRQDRPSLTAIDTLLPRLESQATVANNGIGDVKVFIVDNASAGGPIPAGSILGLDSRYALARVRNTAAEVSAAETYALRQGEAFSLQFGEEVYRLHSDAFDTLVVV